MTKKPSKRTKHVPQRTCVGCRTVLSKRELTRLVHTPDGVIVDQTGKMNGRGVYLHNLRSCWERGLKGAVASALKADISADNMNTLKSLMESMPNETSEENVLSPDSNDKEKKVS